MPSTKVRRAIAAFEKAVINVAFDGAYPHHSDDPREQAELDSIHLAIEHNYLKARAKLERLMENL